MRKKVIRIKSKPFLVMLAVALIVVIASLRIASAAPPFFNSSINDMVFNISQGQSFYFDVNATDPEGDTISYDSLAYLNSSPGSLTWLTFDINNATGEIGFTAGNSDVTYPYTQDSLRLVYVTLRDGNSPLVAEQIWFNISNVNDPPNITFYEPNQTAFSMNESDSRNFTFNYDATDPDIPYGDYLNSSWYVTGILDNILYNGTVYSSNRSWRFNPGYCDAGLKNITLIVSDSYGNTSGVEWNISVEDVNREPYFIGPMDNITWPEDTNLINNISLDSYFFDPDDECGTNIVVYTVEGNHSDHIIITIDDSTGHNVSFTPVHNWYGVEIINFTRFDGYNYTISNNIVLNVTNMPDEPVIQNISNKTTYALAPFLLEVNATSPDCGEACLTYYDNTNLFDIDPSSGLILFTPDGSEIGNFSIMINVSDGTYNVFTTFNLEIINNSRPYIYPIPDQFGQQNTLFTMVVDGMDADGDSMVFWANYSRLGSPSVINSTAVSFSFTPNQDDASLGNISILMMVNDSHGASYSTAFNLSILDINNPPVFNESPAYFIIKLNHSYGIQLNASDDDFDTLLFTDNSSVGTFPNFAMSGSGYISITPNITDLGNHSVRINVSDSPTAAYPLSSAIDVLFIVTPNRAPFIYPLGVQNATEGEPYILQINATDPDEDVLEFFTNSSFNFSSDGWFNFTANQSMVGAHNITVNVTDNDGGWYTTTFILNILQRNDPPYFEPPLQDYPIWLDISEGNLTEIVVNATDDEGDDLSFNSTFLIGDTIFQIVKTGQDRALINFTPDQSMVGNYSVNISVSDGEFIVYVVINFTVQNVNDMPSILHIYPYGTPLSSITVMGWANRSSFPDNITTINATENSTLLFNHTSYDPDMDNLTTRWYLDGGLVSENSSWLFDLEFDSEGWHNLTLIINDSQYYDNMTWQLNITNINRPPVFGKKIFSGLDGFADGTTNQMNASENGLLLGYDNGSYYSEGSYVSEAIDMGIRIAYGNLEWVSSIPYGTNISIATSSSNSLLTGWSNWSYIANASTLNSSPIDSPTRRYLKYMVSMTTNDSLATPQVSELTMNYFIDNLTQVEKYYTIENSSDPWIDLDDFFSDLDDEVLNFSYIGEGDSSVVTIWIETWNGNRVGVRSNTDGTYYVTFIATDQEGSNVSSNKVKLTFTNDPTQSPTSSSSGGGDSTVVQTRTQEVPKEVDKYINMDIVVPEAMTTYQNSTIVSPIKLVNTGDKPLNGIDLTATTNISGVELEFTKTHFDSLGVGESAKTNLIISSPEFLGTYEVTVTANVQDPVFSDSAKILLTTLEKGALNKTQLNTKITFTRDLLLSNPECLELNELLMQAEEQINQSNFVRANELIEETIRYCRHLVTSKDTVVEKPGFLERLYLRIFNLTSKRQLLIFGSVIVLVFVVLTASLVIERIRTKQTIKRKKSEKQKQPPN